MCNSVGKWRKSEREHSDPLFEDNTTLPELFYSATSLYSEQTAQKFRKESEHPQYLKEYADNIGTNKFSSISYSELQDIVGKLTVGFDMLGISRNDYIAIYSETSPEWAHMDFSLLSLGAIVTTIYTESNDKQIHSLLDETSAKGIIVGNSQELKNIVQIEDKLDSLEYIFCLGPVPNKYRDIPKIISIQTVYENGSEEYTVSKYTRIMEENNSPDDIATIIFTSGTTGEPKGVKLTHRNLHSNTYQITKRYGLWGKRDEKIGYIRKGDETVVSYLPLAHIYERVTALHHPIYNGATVAYADSPDTLSEDIKDIRPTTFTAVPLVLQRIYKKIDPENEESSVQKEIKKIAINTARSEAQGESGLLHRIKYSIAERMVFNKIKENLGGRLQMLIVGGAGISQEMKEFFVGVGLDLLEGYGSSECGVITATPLEENRLPAMGVPLCDFDYKIDSNVETSKDVNGENEIGELLVKGPSVFEGYLNKPSITEAKFTSSGYYRTGDIVEHIGDDFLVYHERKSNMFVLKTGKNIHPGPIETKLEENSAISRAILLGEGEKFVSAIILSNNPDKASEAVERVNRDLPRHKTIKEYRIINDEWTVENEMLTPTRKPRRDKIYEEYSDLISEIYS